MAGYELLSEKICGDMVFLYLTDKNTGCVGLTAAPLSLRDAVDLDKEYAVPSLAQVKIRGEEGYVGLFGRGQTMLNSLSAGGFALEDQIVSEQSEQSIVTTLLRNQKNCRLEHKLIWRRGGRAAEIRCAFINESQNDIVLEMLSSFSLCGLTPFEKGDTPKALLLHRLRSRWADEGRLETSAIEDLQLEPSQTKVSANSVRYGQIGSMPVRGYFPFIAIEDVKRSVSWGTQLACPGSWQMEAYRKDDALLITGGLADREFGHWTKSVAPGQRFEAPTAILSVGLGGVDEIAQRLTSWQYEPWARRSARERALPVIFNEWCTSWGNVSEGSVERVARAVGGKGIGYFVIDAGWYDSMGTWNVSPQKFPDGIKQTARMLREKGMIPGLWFEFECVEKASPAFSMIERMLKLDGYTIEEYERHFWDMRDPVTITYLTEKVVDFLRENDFGYLKIDYNANFGLGCDGAESPGEGLRQQLESVTDFLAIIRAELPDLIIENCSSGGHRLEPSMMRLSDMASFSDAHEAVHIPIIAANLHRAILPCQSQIWAVVRRADSERRLYYTMSAGFLGRLCLSGDVERLSAAQWAVVDEGIAFYRAIAPAIEKGYSYRYGPAVRSYRHPEGWQAVLRVAEHGPEGFIVLHTFDGPQNEDIRIDLPNKYVYKLAECYAEHPGQIALDGRMLTVRAPEAFQGMAVRLVCEEENG